MPVTVTVRVPHNHLYLYLTRAYDTATPVSFPLVVDYRGLGGLSVTYVFERSSNREANRNVSNDSGPLETLARNLGGSRIAIRGF